MGWNGGAEILDIVADSLLNEDDIKDEIDVEELLTNLYNVLRDKDWDCVDESEYYEHPILRGIIKEIEPDWFDDEDD